MASIRRKTYTTAVPPDATIVMHKGDRCAKFKVGKRTVFAPLVGDGSRCRVQVMKWTGKYTLKSGQVVEFNTGTTDERAAQKIADARETNASKEAAGVNDVDVSHAVRPIVEHVADYIQSLRNKRRTVDHVKTAEQRVRNVITNCKFARINELDAFAVEQHLAELRDGGLSVVSSNHYVRAIKSFSIWLVETDRAPRDRLKALTTLELRDDDLKRNRRALADSERKAFLKATRNGPEIHRISGVDRWALYIAALYTGFRANELANLRPSCFDWPWCKLEGRFTKNRKPATNPVRSKEAAVLKAWIAAKGFGPNDKLWPGLASKRTADMLAADLERAGIHAKSDGGRLDFHSLRKTFVTMLDEALNVSLKTREELARHSPAGLTMKVYTSTSPEAKVKAVESMPSYIDDDDLTFVMELAPSLAPTSDNVAPFDSLLYTMNGITEPETYDKANAGGNAEASVLPSTDEVDAFGMRETGLEPAQVSLLDPKATDSDVLPFSLARRFAGIPASKDCRSLKSFPSLSPDCNCPSCAAFKQLARVAAVWGRLPAAVRASLVDTAERAVERMVENS